MPICVHEMLLYIHDMLREMFDIWEDICWLYVLLIKLCTLLAQRTPITKSCRQIESTQQYLQSPQQQAYFTPCT